MRITTRYRLLAPLATKSRVAAARILRCAAGMGSGEYYGGILATINNQWGELRLRLLLPPKTTNCPELQQWLTYYHLRQFVKMVIDLGGFLHDSNVYPAIMQFGPYSTLRGGWSATLKQQPSPWPLHDHYWNNKPQHRCPSVFPIEQTLWVPTGTRQARCDEISGPPQHHRITPPDLRLG